MAEYWDPRKASEAIRILHNQFVNSGTLSVRYLSEDPFQSIPVGNRQQQSPLRYTLGSAAYGASPSPSNNQYARPTFERTHSAGSRFASMDMGLDGDINSAFDRLTLQSELESRSVGRGHSHKSGHGHGHGSGHTPSRSWTGPPANHSDLNFPVQDKPYIPLGRHLSEPAKLQGILNNIDRTAHARLQRPPHWNHTVDRQAIPPENRVYPDRIAAGEWESRLR
jgi:hypothetical protein